MSRFDGCNADYAKTNKQTAFTWLRYFPVIEICANLLPVVLLLVGGIFLIHDELTMGEYVAFSGLTWALANPMRQLGNIMNEFQRFSAASTKVMELYYSEPQIKTEVGAIDHEQRFEGKVEFRNVSFQYDDGILPVLRDISFTVLPTGEVQRVAMKDAPIPEQPVQPTLPSTPTPTPLIPQTGDSFPLWLLLALAGISLAGLAVLLYKCVHCKAVSQKDDDETE